MMYKRMKKRFAYCAMLCLLLSLVMDSTLAYFTAESTARNVITSGGVTIELLERQQTEDGLKPYPEDPIAVMPGSTVSKIVSVKNLDEPAWVRMCWYVTLREESGRERILSPEEVSRILTFATDTASWIRKDGWWYCAQPLVSGEESKPLFTQVRFSGPNMTNEYQNSTILIDVTAQAVQKVNNGNTVLEAAGWPNG